MAESAERQRKRVLKACPRTLLIAGILASGLIYTIVWNVLLYPSYFASIYFEWNAEAGFSRISAAPPGRQLHSFKGIIGTLIALEARPWVASEFRNWGWKSAAGRLSVWTPPFPPLVLGVDRLGHWNITDPEVTPLMLAAELDKLELVKQVLAAGADVNARDQRGWTALMHACMKRLASAEIVEALIAAGADVNATDRAGRTALIWAVRDSRGDELEEKVRLLLAAGADPSAKSEFGETPLYEAVNTRNLEVAAQLLAANADPNAICWDGKTALALARRVGETEMVELLERAGGHD